MTKRLSFLGLVLLLSLALLAAWAAPADWFPPARLFADDGGRNDLFGSAIALQGDVAIIGAPYWDSATADDVGAAYVFTSDGQNGAGWNQRARLLAAAARPEELFGWDVALAGNTLAVGAPHAWRGDPGDPNFASETGAVYLFSGSGATWTAAARLIPAELVQDSHFGHALDLDGNTLIAGAYNWSEPVREAVYIYERVNGMWGAPQKLTDPDPESEHNFGAAVAVAGDVALVGAPGDTEGGGDLYEPGVVYVFTRDGGVWSPAGTLTPSNSATGDLFGCALDFDGATAAVVACGSNESLPATLFTHAGVTWTQTAQLRPAEQEFTLADVAVSGDGLVLSAKWIGHDPSLARLFPYRREGGAWVAETPMTGPYYDDYSGFGEEVAINDKHLLAGARGLPRLNVPAQGAVFAYHRAAGTLHTSFAPIVPVPPLESSDEMIAYLAYGEAGSFDVYIVRPDGTSVRNITRSPTDEEAPAWSPDGERLAFKEPRPGGMALVSTDSRGGDKRIILNVAGRHYVNAISWSPDGKRLAFDGRAWGGSSDVFVVNVNGTGLVNLTAGFPGSNDTPTWSPDGTAILFVHSSPDGGVYRQLAVVSPSGGAPTLLTDAGYWHDSPDYSPDGSLILFTSNQGPDPSYLYTMPAAGGERRLLIEHAAMGRWSPNGRRIVFVGESGGFFLASADGRVIKLLSDVEGYGLDWGGQSSSGPHRQAP